MTKTVRPVRPGLCDLCYECVKFCCRGFFYPNIYNHNSFLWEKLCFLTEMQGPWLQVSQKFNRINCIADNKSERFCWCRFERPIVMRDSLAFFPSRQKQSHTYLLPLFQPEIMWLRILWVFFTAVVSVADQHPRWRFKSVRERLSPAVVQ